ncbi:MAG TPA: hypothetical protein VOA87_18555 [Thermoanaerobaculia bacterium]|nr:hypothetical protein [Thermoanaerobaculia bacterium]
MLVNSWITRLVAVGVAFAFGSPLASAMKGSVIHVGDRPSLKEGSPKIVLVEVADFQ